VGEREPLATSLSNLTALRAGDGPALLVATVGVFVVEQFVEQFCSSLSSSGVLRGVLQFCYGRRQFWGVRGDVALSRESCYLESLFCLRHSSQNTCV
jgi:hypothetical protein